MCQKLVGGEGYSNKSKQAAARGGLVDNNMSLMKGVGSGIIPGRICLIDRGYL